MSESEAGERALAAPEAGLFPVAVAAGRRLGLLLAIAGLAVAGSMFFAMGAPRLIAREPALLFPALAVVPACLFGARASAGRAMRAVFAQGRNPFVTGIGVALAAVVAGLLGFAVGYVPYALVMRAPSVFAGFGMAAYVLPFALVAGSPAIVPLGLYFGHRARVARDAARGAGLLPADPAALAPRSAP